MGEYQEVLKPVFEEDVLETVVLLIRGFAKNKIFLSEILRMVSLSNSQAE